MAPRTKAEEIPTMQEVNRRDATDPRSASGAPAPAGVTNWALLKERAKDAAIFTGKVGLAAGFWLVTYYGAREAYKKIKGPNDLTPAE